MRAWTYVLFTDEVITCLEQDVQPVLDEVLQIIQEEHAKLQRRQQELLTGPDRPRVHRMAQGGRQRLKTRGTVRPFFHNGG